LIYASLLCGFQYSIFQKEEAMKVPLEISFRGMEKIDAVEALIREKAGDLEHLCGDIISCRVIVEVPQQHQKGGRPHRVRLNLTIPQGHEVVVRRESSEGMIHDELPAVIRDAFDAAKRQIQKIVEKRRGQVKSPPEDVPVAFVVRLFRDEGYGFIKATDGREFYFHKNAVLNDDFDRLEIGTGVRFAESMGEKGPQASTVQIVDKPGARVGASGESPVEPPLGWEE
jgi:cold shock CspA family protein/ribosome-associated translation inhibitor RaiA